MSASENTERIDMMKLLAEEEKPAVRRPKNVFDKITVCFYSLVCFVTSILLVVIISAATMARYCFEMDLYGYEEWVKIFAFWLYFMGAGYGAFAGTHVSADLVQSYLPDCKLKDSLTFVRCIVTFSVTLLFTYYGWQFFIFGFMGPLGTYVAIPKTVAWRIPLWTAYLAIFLGLLSMSWYFFLELVAASRKLVLGGERA